MENKILIVKHPSGIRRMIEVNKFASLAEVFATVSEQFNLNQKTHELKLGPISLNLNDTIEGSRIPETVVLDIAPKSSSGENEGEPEVLVRMGFPHEVDLYETCSKTMTANDSLWNVIKSMVPNHMAYTDEDICLTYLGVTYKGKTRLSTIKLADLCGRERNVFFMYSGNFLPNSYNRDEHKTVKNEAKQVEVVRPKQPDIVVESRHIAEPTMGNSNPGVVEINERQGRVYNDKYVSNFTAPNERSCASCYAPRESLESGKMLVRIVFPKVAVMEGVFSHKETIQDVANFAKNHLVEKAKQFHFYTVQPRMIVSPGKTLASMKSSPPGTLWYSGKFKSELFKKDIRLSLEGRVFSYVSADVPEESKIDLRATTSMYSWNLNASTPQDMSSKR